MSAAPQQLLVTGVYRSGTTYAERLLDNLPAAGIASQPFPYLYFVAKRRFLDQVGIEASGYPLGTGFHDPHHRPDELAEFLATERFTVPEIQAEWQAMAGYSGALTPQMERVVGSLPEGTFGEVVTAMHRQLADLRAGDESVALVGSKEILVEEFAPVLSANDVRLLVVVRDPRRVVASAQGPGAGRWTGDVRPILHTVRMWRKSVAYALAGGPDVAMVRLEDLTADPIGALRELVGADVEVVLPDELVGVDGAPWRQNTSFDRATTPIEPGAGLSPAQLGYVEALARPEMLVLGYEPSTDDDGRALGRFTPDDDPGDGHPAFTAGFSAEPAELDRERERLDRLVFGPDDDDPRWFVLPGLRSQLADALASSRA